MTWQTIDFHGIVSLDRSLVNQLQLYLDEKEEELSQIIATSIILRPEYVVPDLPYTRGIHHKIYEGLDIFAWKIEQVKNNPSMIASANDYSGVTKKINSAIWEHVELLEGIVVELFQQLDQVSFEQWKTELVEVVEDLKDIIYGNIEDILFACNRLEPLLWEYRWICEKREKLYQNLHKPLFFWKKMIDPRIVRNLEKSQKYLNFRYQNFVNRFELFDDLYVKIERSLVKFLGYNVLNTLDTEEQTLFKRLYQLLKLWDQNRKLKVLPQREPVRVLRSSVSPEKAKMVFHDYFRALKEKLFQHSREIKREDTFDDPIRNLEMQGTIAIERLELHTLGATASKYRDFLLRTDPDPYVRTRWGFGEWIVGPEPTYAKKLLELEYEVESLDSLFVHFTESLQKKENREEEDEVRDEILKNIHEMGQPLSSKSMMRVRCERLTEQLKQLDELGARDRGVVDFVMEVLSKGMRADWKYHILHEFPLFHKLYAVHIGILGPIEDRSHINRLSKFKRLLGQLEEWVRKNQTLKHFHDIELDMNDIKGYLQDFLAHVQRVSNDATVFNKNSSIHVVRELSQQLLEYRYLFGDFFQRLRENESEEKLLRNQFLFVDQYFEAVENKLAEMRNIYWDEPTEEGITGDL